MTRTPPKGSESPAYGDPASMPPSRALGEVKINEELLATVACYAALETPGVVWNNGKRTVEEIAGRKEIERGANVVATGEKRVSVAMEINVEYGYDIYETTLRMQRAVKDAIEHMSSFAVEKVDVSVKGVYPRRPHAPGSNGNAPGDLDL